MTIVHYLLLSTITLATVAQAQKTPEVPIPKSITIDKGLSASQARVMQETALYYYAFWNTGRQQYLDKALAPGFVDNTLPKGRPQGPSGPVLASRTFRNGVAHVPQCGSRSDLYCK